MFEMNNDFSFNEFNQEDKVCPRCSMTLSELKRTGIVGCAYCYKIFENEIRQLLLQKQGTFNHIGKISSKHISKIKVREKIEELEREKEIAAKEENFIVAEALKNQIEKLKGEL